MQDGILYAYELIKRCYEEGYKNGSIFIKLDGALSDSVRRGKPCIIEDIELAPASVLESINGLFENDRVLPGIIVPDEFRCITICTDVNALSSAMHSRLTIFPVRGYTLEDKVKLTMPVDLKANSKDISLLWEQTIKALEKSLDSVPLRLLIDLRNHVSKQSPALSFIERFAYSIQLFVFQMAGITPIQINNILTHLPNSLLQYIQNYDWVKEGEFLELSRHSGLQVPENHNNEDFYFPEPESKQRLSIAACSASLAVDRAVIFVGASGQGKTAVAGLYLDYFRRSKSEKDINAMRIVLSGGTSLADLIGRHHQKMV